MNAQFFLVATAFLACSACTPAPAGAPTAMPGMQHSAVPAPTAAPATSAAPTSDQPASVRGNIVGTIATNPWHAIKGGGVVYLEDGPKDNGISRSAILDNHDMAFVPYIVVISAGASVIFTNTDPMVHNVFSPDGEKWDLGEIPAERLGREALRPRRGLHHLM